MGVENTAAEYVARLVAMEQAASFDRGTAEQCAIEGLALFLREHKIIQVHVDYERSIIQDVLYEDQQVSSADDSSLDFDAANTLVGWVPPRLFPWREGFVPQWGSEYYLTLAELEQALTAQ